MANLPPLTQRVFRLYRLEHKTPDEIAKILGVSSATVALLIEDIKEALMACHDIFE